MHRWSRSVCTGLIFAAFIPAFAHAQSDSGKDSASVSNRSQSTTIVHISDERLRGTKLVCVSTADGREYVGRLFSVNLDTVEVYTGSQAGLVAIPRSQVGAIYECKNQSLKGARWGLLVGALVGVFIYASGDEFGRTGKGPFFDDLSDKTIAFGLSIGFGTTLGAIIGSTIYAPDRGKSIFPEYTSTRNSINSPTFGIRLSLATF
jgi:hypothetical protein